MTTAFAGATALAYPEMITSPHVLVSLNGPRGGNQGTAGISADEARSFATQLIAAAAAIDGKPCELIRLAPFEIAALGAAVSFGDSFTTDWIENEGANDPDAAKGAADVELAEQIVSRIEAAHGAIADLTPCNTADEPTAYEEEPEELRTGLFRVRFFMLTTTCDRHSIQVRASGPDAAKARVDAWRRELIELTHDEELTENLDKEMDVQDSQYDGLAEQPWDAPTELEEATA